MSKKVSEEDQATLRHYDLIRLDSDMPRRTLEQLIAGGITTYSELEKQSRSSLLLIPGICTRKVFEIEAHLRRGGMRLRA